VISQDQFEARLAAYLAGDADDDGRKQMQEYMQAHPEAAALKSDIGVLDELCRLDVSLTMPPALSGQAREALARALPARFKRR
jgi:anti-sigma factor RsiW